jgi:hypothetical protein
MNDLPSVDALRAIAREAVNRFNGSTDRDTLLRPLEDEAEPVSTAWHAAHERSIAHRLAFYFECNLRDKGFLHDKSSLSVDCEYDRHIDDHKKLRTILENKWIIDRAGRTWFEIAAQPGAIEFLVKPDIVLHQRRNDDRNLIVFELKKASSREFREYDDLKLCIFTTPKPKGYNYQLGFAVTIRDDVAPEDRILAVDAEYYDGSR